MLEIVAPQASFEAFAQDNDEQQSIKLHLPIDFEC